MKFCNSHLMRNIFNLYMLCFFFDLVYVCTYKGIMSIFVLFESNLYVPVNIFPLLTELRCCPSYVKQTSKQIWRGKEY